MNLYNEAVYKSRLMHSAKGQSWGKHKYIAIKNGRYIYPEDLQKSNGLNYSKQMEAQKRAEESRRSKKTAAEILNKKERPGVTGQTTMKTVIQDTARRKQAKAANSEYRSRQINDQIKSAHSNATSSKMELTSGNELKKRAEERKAAASASSTKTKEQEIAEQIKRNNSGTIPEKKEESKKEETKTETTASTTETATEEKKSGSGKGKGGGKKGSGKKSSSKKSETKTEQTTAANASEEAKTLGLTDDDIKALDDSIDLSATDRETVIRNLALRVIKGDFGNGTDRRKKLGKYYNDIQKKVNELMKELKSSKSSEVQHSDPGSYTFNLLKDRGSMGIFKFNVDVLQHGNRNSGRYPRGSGERPWQHEGGHGNSRRRASDMSDDDLKKAVARKGLERQYKKMYGGSKLEKTKTLIDETTSAVNRVNNKNREKLNRRPQHERMNLDGMTDKELRDKINRELLEKQYSDLFGPEVDTVSKGERKAAEVLDYAGDVLAISSSALAIALAIKGLKG